MVLNDPVQVWIMIKWQWNLNNSLNKGDMGSKVRPLQGESERWWILLGNNTEFINMACFDYYLIMLQKGTIDLRWNVAVLFYFFNFFLLNKEIQIEVKRKYLTVQHKEFKMTIQKRPANRTEQTDKFMNIFR